MRTLNQILGGIPMTATAQGIRRGLPNVLPPAFLNVTRRVVGNTVKYRKVDGNRQLARLAQYGAPSQLVGVAGIAQATAVLMHSFEHMQHDPLVLQNIQSDNGQLQEMAVDEIDRQTADFMERYNSLRVSAVYSMLANGKIWSDASGNLLFTSSGAVETIDFNVPANNRNQLNGIISASWATSTTDVMGQIAAIKQRALQESGYEIRHAFYGINVPGYLAKNDTVKTYLGGNPRLAEQMYGGSEIGMGFAGIQWHPVYNAFGVNAAGTVTEFFGADSVAFTPDPSPDWYEFVEGSYMVPRSIDVTGSAAAAMGNLQTVFGKFGYAVVDHDPVGIKHYAGDTFLPLLKVGKAVYLADVTP